MKKVIGKRIISLVLAALICVSVSGGMPAYAADLEEGTTVTADASSPTGYTVQFVYKNETAEKVQLCGDLSLLKTANIGTSDSAIRYEPEDWQTGMYHTGGKEFIREMVKDENGYWTATIPMHAGALSYWYRVWDSSKEWVNKRIWDPTSSHVRPTATDPDDNGTPYRVRNNDVLDAVYVPYDAKQNDEALLSRATYELPIADPDKKGTVQYIPYTTVLGDEGYMLGVYLPAGYDPDREEPYKVVYAAHGIFGDETDWMVPGSTPHILDNMIARGEIEPTVFVTMGNHFTGRTMGFASYNRDNAAKNLVETILPKIEADFNVSSDRTGRGYIGFSMGSMTGAAVLEKYADEFAYYGLFCGSGTYNDGVYDNIVKISGTKVPSIFMGRGSFEGDLKALNVIRDNFRARGIPSETALVPGAHDMMTAGQLFTMFAKDYLWKEIEANPFTILSDDNTLDRSGGNITATVKVDLTEGVDTHSGDEVVIFQLMKGDTPVSIVGLKRDITTQEEFTAYFNVDAKDTTYSVKVFVFDSFNSDLTAPVSLAAQKVLK